MVVRVLFGLLLSLSAGLVSAATIETELDRNPVTVNESFLLTFNVQGTPDGEPDFSPLEVYFDILGRSHSNQFQIINGNMQATQQWQLTLMAREPGSYMIPAIAFGNDQSNTLALEVTSEPVSTSSETGPLFLEAQITPQQAYVQSQLLYTVRLYRSVNLRSGNLSEPKVSGVDAIIEPLGEDRNFETLRNGVRYAVLERRYTISPQHAGTLTVEPTVFQGQIIHSRFPFNETLRAKRLTSKSFRVDVQPIPETARRPWLPAEDLQLAEEWPQDPPRFRVGEPLTRTITLKASGISAVQLPSLGGNLPEGLKQYPDQPILNNQVGTDGVIAIRQEKIAIVPNRSGRFELPAIEIPWWDMKTGRQQIARIPAHSIEVAAAPESATSATATTAPPPVEPIAVIPDQSTTNERGSAGVWPWVSLVLFLGWSATALLWWRQRTPRNRTVAAPKPVSGLREVKRACRMNDAQACKSALLDWGKSCWRERPPTSLGAFARRVDPAFASAIADLNQSLYAGDGHHSWEGSELLRAAQQWSSATNESGSTPASPIAALHPRRARIT